MNLTLFGATGGTGSAVLRQALDAGHKVTAVVRDPRRLAIRSAHGLDVVTANVDDPERIAALVADADAVISAIGARDRGPTSVCASTIDVIISAMYASATTRLLAVSASGAHTTGDGALVRTVVKPALNRMLRHVFADMRAMERRIQDSALDWTIVRPPMLTDGRRTGSVRSRVDANVRGAFSISRADLADFLLRAMDDRALIRRAVSVAHA